MNKILEEIEMMKLSLVRKKKSVYEQEIEERRRTKSNRYEEERPRVRSRRNVIMVPINLPNNYYPSPEQPSHQPPPPTNPS